MFNGETNMLEDFLSLLDKLRPYLGRVLAAAITAWLAPQAAKIGVEISPEHSLQIAVFIIAVVYGVGHKLANSKINPQDTATTKKS